MDVPISKAFLRALADTFEEFGRDAVRGCRDKDPVTYASVYAHVLPNPVDIHSDEQLEQLCDCLSERLEKAARNGVETIH
jgi:hypothetical protein